MRFNVFVQIMISLALLFGGCSSSTDEQETWPGNLNFGNLQWSEIGDKRIYFGHQSVGMNVINGLSEVSSRSQTLKLNIVDFKPKVSIDEIKVFTTSLKGSSTGFFAHGGVGRNGDPLSKLRDFEKQIDEGFGGNLDIVLFKFCYKDFNDRTDVEKVFGEYTSMVSRLNIKYPELDFVHVTAPLRNPRPKWKNRVKLMLGVKTFQEYEYNLVRASYNKKLIETYKEKDSIFDLAQLESTRPDGTTEGFVKSNREYQTIYPNYTYDGGHLTPLGRRIMANGLLAQLVTN